MPVLLRIRGGAVTRRARQGGSGGFENRSTAFLYLFASSAGDDRGGGLVLELVTGLFGVPHTEGYAMAAGAWLAGCVFEGPLRECPEA